MAALKAQLKTHTKRSWRQWHTKIHGSSSPCSHSSHSAAQVCVLPCFSVSQTLPTPSSSGPPSPHGKVWDCVCVCWEVSVLLSTPAICFGGVGTWGHPLLRTASLCCSREESSSRLFSRNGVIPLLGCSGNTQSGDYPPGQWCTTPLAIISASLFSCTLCPCPQ